MYFIILAFWTKLNVDKSEISSIYRYNQVEEYSIFLYAMSIFHNMSNDYEKIFNFYIDKSEDELSKFYYFIFSSHSQTLIDMLGNWQRRGIIEDAFNNHNNTYKYMRDKPTYFEIFKVAGLELL